MELINSNVQSVNIVKNIIDSYKALMQFDVSVIIVNWNSGDFLKKTVESLYETTQDINFELIVVDNNSDKTDQSYGH